MLAESAINIINTVVTGLIAIIAAVGAAWAKSAKNDAAGHKDIVDTINGRIDVLAAEIKDHKIWEEQVKWPEIEAKIKEAQK